MTCMSSSIVGHDVSVGSVLLTHLPADDYNRFRQQFENSIRMNVDLLAFAQIKTKPNSPESLEPHASHTICFELRGRPVSLPDTTILLVVAKPYPSRNTEM
jgi:hypothetical protein